MRRDSFGWLAAALLVSTTVTPTAGAQLALGPPFQINTTPHTTTFNTGQAYPDIAIGPDGERLIVWNSANSTESDPDWSIQAQRHDEFGTPVGGQFQVNTVTSGTQRQPRAVILETGEAIVVWENATDIAGQRYDAMGNPNGAEFVVAATTAEEFEPDIAAAPDGVTWVVWAAREGALPMHDVWLQRYDAMGDAIGSPLLVAHTSFYLATYRLPRVSVSSTGEGVVVWGESNFDVFNNNAQRFDATGAAVGSQILVWNGGLHSSVAHEASGSFVIAFEDLHFDDDENLVGTILLKRYTASGTPSFLRTVSTQPNYHRDPSIAVAPDGTILVTWTRIDPGEGGPAPYVERVRGRRYLATGVPMSVPFDISVSSSRSSPDPRTRSDAAYHPDGTAIVAFDVDVDEQESVTDLQLFARVGELTINVPGLGAIGLLLLAFAVVAGGAARLRKVR